MAQPKLIWDATISDELNFHVLKPKIIDRAVSIGRVFGLDEFGLAYEVMSDAEFFILAGHAAMIRQPAGLAHGAGAFLTNWKKADDMEGLQKAGSNELRGLILDVYPDRLLAPMKVNKSLRTRPTQYIMMALQDRHGTLSKLDLDFLMAQLKNAHQNLHPMRSLQIGKPHSMILRRRDSLFHSSWQRATSSSVLGQST